MSTVSFQRAGQTILRLHLTPEGIVTGTEGDASWFDLDYRPYSARLGQNIHRVDEPREWALALQQVYAPTGVTVTFEDAGPQPSAFGVPGFSAPSPGYNSPAYGGPAYGAPAWGSAAAAVFPGAASQLPGWWRRAGAYIIDSFIVTVPGGLLGEALERSQLTLKAELVRVACVLVVATLLYIAWMTRGGERNGRTPGKRMAGLRVVRDDGRPLTAMTVFSREIIFKFLLSDLTCGLFSLFDVLWPLGEPRHRALHDKAVGTRVIVEAPRRPGFALLAVVLAVLNVAAVGYIGFVRFHFFIISAPAQVAAPPRPVASNAAGTERHFTQAQYFAYLQVAETVNNAGNGLAKCQEGTLIAVSCAEKGYETVLQGISAARSAMEQDEATMAPNSACAADMYARDSEYYSYAALIRRIQVDLADGEQAQAQIAAQEAMSNMETFAQQHGARSPCLPTGTTSSSSGIVGTPS